MKKILCIGASVDLPRDEVKYEDTWYYLLQEKYRDCNFICYFKRAMTLPESDIMYNNYYKFYYPDYVVWEIGITDTAPRYIIETKQPWRVLLKIVSLINMTKAFWWVIKKTRKRKPHRVLTPIEQFEYYSEKLIKEFIEIGVKKIIILKIEPIGSSPQQKNQYWLYNINIYNDIYDKLAKKYKGKVVAISPKKNAKDDSYIADGYHPNKKGMKMVFDELDCLFSGLL